MRHQSKFQIRRGQKKWTIGHAEYAEFLVRDLGQVVELDQVLLARVVGLAGFVVRVQVHVLAGVGVVRVQVHVLAGVVRVVLDRD